MTSHNDIRKGQSPGKLSREVFGARFRQQYVDPAFDAERDALARLEAIAWEAYIESRKAPHTRKAGAGFADPDYDLSLDWLAARDALIAAEAEQRDPHRPSRVLVISGSARNDGSCPGENAKSWRLAQLAREELHAAGTETELLDLSLITSEYGRRIHPCKACVSTAMPLCHWPCSCYPNHALAQTDDAMNEIYRSWTRAHGVLIVTPVYWLQAPAPLKLMIDRLVCADGGNTDPTSTQGKDAAKAKAIELAGWDFPQHLAGRSYGLVVHGDAEGTAGLRDALRNWLDGMGLLDAGEGSRLERMIGYYQPYATSHAELDRDHALQQEVRNVARALAHAVGERRAGRWQPAQLERPRAK